MSDLLNHLFDLEAEIGKMVPVDQHEEDILMKVRGKIASARVRYEGYLRRINTTHSICREVVGLGVFESDDPALPSGVCTECHLSLRASPPRSTVALWMKKTGPVTIKASVGEPVPAGGLGQMKALPVCDMRDANGECTQTATGTCFHCHAKLCDQHAKRVRVTNDPTVTLFACSIHAMQVEENETLKQRVMGDEYEPSVTVE